MDKETVLTDQGERQVSMRRSRLQMALDFKAVTVAICDSCLPEGVDLLLPEAGTWGFRFLPMKQPKPWRWKVCLNKVKPHASTVIQDKGWRLVEENRFTSRPRH